MPLIIQGNTIALLMGTSYRHDFKLSKADIDSISRFCEQIAGAINSSSLFKNLEDERQAIEKVRMENDKLSEFSKKLNETVEFTEILEQPRSSFVEIFAVVVNNLLYYDARNRENRLGF